MKGNTCNGCGAEVLWIKVTSGAKVPVNPEKVWVKPETGCGSFIREDGSLLFGRKVGDAFDDPGVTLAEVYESHYATCPVGGMFSNRKPRTRPPGYR